MAIRLRSRGSTTSSCSSATTTSAAPGGRTPTPAARATSPRTSTRSRSRRTPTGAGRTPRSRRSALPARLRGALRPVPHDPVRRRRSTAAEWDDAAGAGGSRPHAGPVDARVLVAGVGPLAEPRSPTSRGSTASRAPIFHSARWDHDHDLTGERVAVDRHRRVGDPVRARDPAEGRAAARLPAHAAVGHAAHDRPITRRRAAPLPAAARRCSGRPRRRLRGARAARARLRQAPAAHGAARADRAAAPPRRRCATPRCGRALTPDYTHRLQADPAVQRLVSGAHAAERRARHRRDRRGPAHGDRDRRRRRAARSTRSSSAPASTSPTCRSAATCAAATGARLADAWDGQPAGAPRHHGRRLPQPLPAARPEHRPRPQLDGLHDRVADRVRRSTRCA